MPNSLKAVTLSTAWFAVHPYVHLITFDISKAFDSIRHRTLMDKLADLPIPDRIYNWMVEYFQDRCHVTKVGNTISAPVGIHALFKDPLLGR